MQPSAGWFGLGIRNDSEANGGLEHRLRGLYDGQQSVAAPNVSPPMGPACKITMSRTILVSIAQARRPPAPRLANDDGKRRGGSGAPGTAVISKTKPQTKRPNLYRVLLLNDDYTPMEFVVHVLEQFFNKDAETARRIMMHVHQHGIGECGVYTYEVAETKVTQVMDFARKHQHPLQCVMEKK